MQRWFHFFRHFFALFSGLPDASSFLQPVQLAEAQREKIGKKRGASKRSSLAPTSSLLCSLVVFRAALQLTERLEDT